jgi:iron complex transport system substrate-binding protein
MPQLRLSRFSRWMWPICIALLWGGVAGAQPRPQRVVSLNLCTDEMLLTLADRDQIASLSFLIKDPSISFMTEEAQGLPVNDGRAETILFSGPDLVLSGTYGQQGQAALLQAQGLKVLTLGPWTSLKEGQEQIRTMARALGHPERGEALIARIDAALQRTKDIVPGKPSILVYDRGSWVSSTDSPMNELLIHMGFKPHQEALGLPHGGMARLETIVTAPPDFLLLDDDSDKAVDNGTALFVHPALVRAVPLERRLVVPRKLTICGGPSTPAAIDALAAEIRAKVH